MKKRNSIILSGLAVVCLLSGGCLGGGVVHSKSKSLEHFSLGYRGSIRPESEQLNPTVEQVENLWGKPDSTRNEEGTVVWRYTTGVRMAGAVPMVGVGIPLIVPTGCDYTDIYIKSGVAIKAYESYTSWSGGYYGPADESTGRSTFNKLRDE